MNTPTPSSASDYTFGTEIVNTANSNLTAGSWNDGVSATMSGETFGMLSIPNLGWLSFYRYGWRVFDFTNNLVTLLTGQSQGTPTVLDNSKIQMDTQFAYDLSDCGSG